MMNINSNQTLVQEFHNFNVDIKEIDSGPAYVTNIDLDTSSAKLSNIIDDIID